MLKVGVDISKLTIDCGYRVDGKNKHHKFANNNTGFKQLLKWLKINKSNPKSSNLRSNSLKPNQDIIFCMEATGIYHLTLAKFLFDLSFKVIVANPIKTHHFAKVNMSRNKTDKVDALLIAKYCEYLYLDGAIEQSLWHPKSQEYEDLQYITTRLEQLEEQKGAESNRLGITNNKIIIKSLKLSIKHISKQISILELSLKALINDNKDLDRQVKLLKTINGIGNKTSWALLAYVGDFSEFNSANKITSFAGLNPKQRQSGTSVTGSSLSKMGHRKLRKSLYMPALVAIRYNPVLKSFYERLLAKGKVKMLAVVAVMRKLLVLCYGVLKSGVAFDVSYGK